jgi:putative ABC transport system ATP-binding protein
VSVRVHIWQLDDDALAIPLEQYRFRFQDFHLFPCLTGGKCGNPVDLKSACANRSPALTISRWSISRAAPVSPVKLVARQQRAPPLPRHGRSSGHLGIRRVTASLDGDTGRRILAFVHDSPQ